MNGSKRSPLRLVFLFVVISLSVSAGLRYVPSAASDFSVASTDGKVVRIVDGDTVVIETTAGKRERIRLAGIDAPERNQPWGDAATRELRRQVAGKTVLVSGNKRDRYDRLIGVLLLDGEDQNLHLVDRGLAWHYKRYQDEQHPDDRRRYAQAEIDAQTARRGLWSDPDPVAPWDWRRR